MRGRRRPRRSRARISRPRAGLAIAREIACRELSHGEQKQLELAIALAAKPRLLLLDEPMAGLGTAESARMIDLLKG